jgi:hypothetical protein
MAVAVALLVVVVGASAVGAAQWYANGGPQDFRSAVSFVGEQARPGDGMLIFAPYERMPIEWYMADHPATERAVQPVYPATAWGVDPLYFDGSVTLPPAAVARAAARYQRIWLVSATADLSLYPDEASAVEGALRRAGFEPAGTRHFRGVQVTEEVRR